MNRIVVIEDDPAILRGLADTLRAESYDVRTATDGREGYALVTGEPPDLVILDLMLPGLDGYQVCWKIRAHGLATPVLMLTAQSQEARRVEGFDAGADDYVTKPFSLRELLGRVRAILKRSEGRSDLANQRELDEARRLQRRLMPDPVPQVVGLGIAGIWRPARIAGGDYFDVLEFPDGGVAVLIADVSGKGMPAALVMSSLQAAVHAYAPERLSPAALCVRLNRSMIDNLAGQGFVSFCYAVIDPARRQLTCCNAGHNPPILARSDGTIARLDRGGGVLGVVPGWTYDDSTLALESGDRLLMYTDGVTECRNPEGEELGDDRLTVMLRKCGAPDAAAVARDIVAGAGSFSNGRFEDDLTVLAVTVT